MTKSRSELNEGNTLKRVLFNLQQVYGIRHPIQLVVNITNLKSYSSPQNRM